MIEIECQCYSCRKNRNISAQIDSLYNLKKRMYKTGTARRDSLEKLAGLIKDLEEEKELKCQRNKYKVKK